MDYKFWLQFGVSLAYVWLLYSQVKLMASQAIPIPSNAAVGAGIRNWSRKYWPIFAMIVLAAISWLPYFLDRPHKELIANYGSADGKIFAQVDSSALPWNRPDRLMLLARVVDMTVDYKRDTHIARSATFEVTEPYTNLALMIPPNFGAAMSGGTVDIYLFGVREDYPIESVTSIGNAEKLGAKELDSKGFNFSIVALPVPTPSPAPSPQKLSQ